MSEPARGESTPEQVDAEFARIIANFDAVPSLPDPPQQAEEQAANGPVWPAGGPVLNRVYEPSLLDGLDTFGAHLPDDTPEQFVPPPPPPLPRIPFAAIMAVLLIIVGFVLFFDNTLLPLSAQVNTLLGLTSVLGGVAALIMRLRPGTDEDDYPHDDGAVV